MAGQLAGKPDGKLDSAVVLVTGVMAAGKSTVAQLLAERLPRAAHVRGDVFRRMLVTGRRDPAPEQPDGADESDEAARADEAAAQLRLRHRAMSATADLYAEAGWTAIAQDVVLGPHLAHCVARVRTRPLYVVVLAPGAVAVERREAGRAKSGYGQGPWTVAALDRALREETPRLGLWLNTSRQSPGETVDEILARLDEARVDAAADGG